MSYKYYDTPDGHDCFKKLWLATKYGTIFGISVSTVDVLMYSHPKGYFQTAARYAYLTGPLAGMAIAFTATTCVATNIRNRDDHFNYLLGGCAVGSIYGTWRKSGYAGFVACCLLGVAACVMKSYVNNGWEVCPPIHRAYGGIDHYQKDWSLVKERPRGWKLAEE